MKFKSMLFILNICVSSVIHYVTSEAILGLATQGQTLGNPTLESENCQCRPCCSSTTSTYQVGTQKVNWYQAYVLCKQYGMELASITSTNEENALENYTKTIETKSGPYGGYWLAGTRYGTASSNSDFVWFTTGKPVIYRKFAAGQPDNAGGNEPCLELFMSGPGVFLWNDIDCNQKLGFICQSSKTCF